MIGPGYNRSYVIKTNLKVYFQPIVFISFVKYFKVGNVASRLFQFNLICHKLSTGKIK